MLRKLIAGTIVVNFVFMLASVLTTSDLRTSGLALANTTATFGVGAVVPQFLEINADLYQLDDNGDIDWQSNPGSLDFGTLQEVTNASGALLYMAGENAYAVVMYPITSGHQYELAQTGTPLTNGAGDTIPNGAYVMTPDYQELDTMGGVAQGAMPGGAYLSPPISAVGNINPIYTSDTIGITVAVRSFLAITGPDVNGNIMNYAQGHNGDTGVGTAQYYHGNGVTGNWEPVTQSQPDGSYSGSVTYTLNLI